MKVPAPSDSPPKLARLIQYLTKNVPIAPWDNNGALLNFAGLSAFPMNPIYEACLLKHQATWRPRLYLINFYIVSYTYGIKSTKTCQYLPILYQNLQKLCGKDPDTF